MVIPQSCQFYSISNQMVTRASFHVSLLGLPEFGNRINFKGDTPGDGVFAGWWAGESIGLEAANNARKSNQNIKTHEYAICTNIKRPTKS
jgi:hypothetical protein